MTKFDIDTIRKLVSENAPRIKQLGNWPDNINEASLISRIPTDEGSAPGFDAGIACCLDLIPRDKQRLSAILHAAYTPEAIKQIRKEKEIITRAYNMYMYDSSYAVSNQFIEAANTETVWWAMACNICDESISHGGIDVNTFLLQLDKFKWLSEYAESRIESACNVLYKTNTYHVVDNTAVALVDGGMQAAYIDGYSLAVMPAYGIWFVGTYYPSLGLDDFSWSNEIDDKGRAKSGPVFGSKQFVKCATFKELNDVLEVTKKHLSI